METRNISFTRYRDGEGRPTCAANGGACRLLFWPKTIGFSDAGKVTCAYIDGHNARLSRRDDSTRYLEPHADCPLWRDER